MIVDTKRLRELVLQWQTVGLSFREGAEFRSLILSACEELEAAREDAQFVPIESLTTPPTTGLYLSPRTKLCTTYIAEYHEGRCVDSMDDPLQLLCIAGRPIRIVNHE